VAVRKLGFCEGMEAFLLYCKSKGLAERTVETYALALNSLKAFLAQEGSPPPIPSPHQLRAFIVHMLDRGLSRTTISIRMRAIRAFLSFLVREGFIEKSPMENVEIPKVPKQYPRVLTPEEIKRLVRACNSDTWTGIRNRAMVLTFLDTGIRLNELIALDLEDVDLQSRFIQIRRGKGAKERHVFMGRHLFRALRKWVEVRGLSSPERAFFLGRNGERLDKRNVQRILERLARRAGLDGVRVSPHVLRHTFATMYIKNGGDPFSLQRILGHSDIKTTMIYVNLAGVALRAAHAKASPVDRLYSSKW